MRVLVTGANGGLGLEACAQLASQGVKTVILGCRTQAKAEDAIVQLVAKTGKPAETFQMAIIDTSSNSSCREAVANLPSPLDGLICNAGGIGRTPKDMTDSGAVCLFAQNIVGHGVLIEELLSSGKISAGGKIVCSGSEQARGITELSMKRPPLEPLTAEHFASLINGTAIKDFNKEAYASAKAIGALYVAALARKHREQYFLMVSPGGTSGTKLFDFLPTPIRWGLSCLLKITGQMHDVRTGAARYVEPVMAASNVFPSGTFVASLKGQTGKVGDQIELWDVFGDVAAQDAAFEAMHQYMQ